MKNAKTKVVKVDLPGFHRFQERIFQNYCLIIMHFDEGTVKYIPWEIVFEMISQFSPIKKVDNENFDEAALEQIFENSELLGLDIESTDFTEMTEIIKLSFYLLELYQRYNEPDNIYVSRFLNPPKHEKN